MLNSILPCNAIGDMVGVVILASMRGQFRGQLHSVAEPAAEPEAAGQLARIWHNWDEALLK